MTCAFPTDLAGQIVRCTRPGGHDGPHRDDPNHLEWEDPPVARTENEPMDVDLPLEGMHTVAFAIKLHANQLEAEAKALDEKGEAKMAAELRRKVETLRGEVVEPDEADRGKFILKKRHRLPAEKGIELLIKRRKNLVGTLRGSDMGHWVPTVEEDVARLEANLLPLFQEQAALPLEPE